MVAEPIAPPTPDTPVAPEVTQAATEPAQTPVDEDIERAEDDGAPEAETSEIVTEAEEPAFAPEISSRPQTRPNRPAPAQEPSQAAEPETQTASSSSGSSASDPEVDPVAAAIAEAAAASSAETSTEVAGLAGGTLSDSEKADLRREIRNCWSVGSASTAALNTIVTVEWIMNPNGTIDSNSFDLVSFSGGAQADADVAYRMARSAIARCQTAGGRSGYTLPAGEFQEPVRLRLSFDPSEMRLR